MDEQGGTMGQTEKFRVMLVDGMALLFRAYYAEAAVGRVRRTSYGLPTGAVYGFVRYAWDALRAFRPTHLVCCWDAGGGTFRSERYPAYKANRSAPPDDLVPQFDLVKQVTAGLGFRNVEAAGWEADDCIGTLAGRFAKDGADVYVLTGDRDMLQLIDGGVKVVLMKRGFGNYAVYDEQALLEETGLTPRQIIDLKGLMGDPADHYPGVRGIGEKTALRLLQEHGSVEGILDALETLPKGVRAKIEADVDMLHLSRDLACIRTDAPVECGMDECVLAPDFDRAKQLFQELEMNSLLRLIS
jgi:5'-3' exonuclease